MRTNTHKTVIYIFFLFICLSQTAFSADLCVPRGYTFGFFNGVWNTPPQAADGLAALRSIIGDTYNSEPIQYEVFYNHTGRTVRSTGLQDIAGNLEKPRISLFDLA